MCEVDDSSPMTPLELKLVELQNARDRITLLESDLEEWTKTFEPYGCEPQACLATLLKGREVAPDKPQKEEPCGWIGTVTYCDMGYQRKFQEVVHRLAQLLAQVTETMP